MIPKLDLGERERIQQVLGSPATIWVNSWGTPCGISEYTRHLVDEIPSLHVTARPPEPRTVRLLHIQHEPGIYHAESLTQYTEQAQQAGLPLAITEHRVVAQMCPWEADAEVLISLTAHGTEILKKRWPYKQVYHFPCGCPTWSLQPKAVRGKVIGAFGFLHPTKGFWRLLEVLRALPGTQLLMFSHARKPGVEERWEQDAAGLPVRRIAEFLPIREIACHLAMEADILVYWYDEVPHAAASAAVRVGLATGVPVLASPTQWFRDLQEVTYQPSDLLEGVRRLLEDTELRDRLTASAREYCHRYSWPRVVGWHLELWNTMTDNSRRRDQGCGY